ncbi:MAG: response regulator transcription factor [Bacteroidota bacterium]
MTTKAKILIAEDDKNLGYVLSEYLKMHHFEVHLTRNGVEALNLYHKHDFDLGIFDIMMPEMDGFTLAKKIREVNADLPFIFLTAKALMIDKLKGFNIGADDYVVKPVDEEELIARIKAILKRSNSNATAASNHKFEIGKYHFDFKNQKLIIDKEQRILTFKEAEILKALCESKGQILDRKTILKRLWGGSDYFNRKSMDVFIYKLRKYLSKDSKVKIINVHGKGFILEVSV